MAELDKFKRRVIRSVARKLFQEKKSENELWTGLKKETKCDCKVLWERMRALTLKKLKRLLVAEDKLELIIPAAQMSLTDWLLFDLVLVHEDIDVIGRDIRGTTSEIQPLLELLDLTQHYNIENKTGSELVAAWTLVTYTYNNRGRQCSPMLLQKRWYQLKKQTREDFYAFWFNYRGNAKLLPKAKQFMPSKLEMEVAKRVPKIITDNFFKWEQLVEKRLVILPEEFENKFRSQSIPAAVTTKDNEPDLVLLEPNIETIELPDVESDSDNAQENNNQSKLANTSKSVAVVVKSEPVDENNLGNQANPEQLVEELRERDTKLLQSIPDIDSDDDEREAEDVGIIDNIETREENNVTTDNTDTANIHVENDSSSEYHIYTHDVAVNSSNSLIPSKIIEPIVMPQITNVFGNVDVDTDILSKYSRAISTEVLETCIDVSVEQNSVLDNQVYNNDEEKQSTIVDNQLKTDDIVQNHNVTSIDKVTSCSNVENAQDTNPFLGVPIDLTFADDGIELVDDGIEYEDEEDIIKPYGNTKTTSEFEIPIKVEENKAGDEGYTNFDTKLLMQLMVCITRLEDMAVLKNRNIDSIRDKQLIDSILNESKRVKKQNHSVNMKQELHEESKPIDDNNSSGDEMTSETEEISEDLKVKPSSCLLQKPRGRSYNPIQLCKNPDFNTRLKRLTVGFLSSARNRAMLKTLKPLTIDLSKAFESRLLNGTLYLKANDTSVPVAAVMEVDQQVTSVLPSAMPVQSLIDQVTPQQVVSVANLNSTPKTPKDEFLQERNKTITLPDIEKVRKMNQRLYIAEVTPMRVVGPNEKCMPPVQLVNKPEKLKNKTSTIADKEKNTLLEPQANISNQKDKSAKLTKKPTSCSLLTYKDKRNEWSTVSWLAKSTPVYNNDTSLITFDTFNKMLNVLNFPSTKDDKHVKSNKKVCNKKKQKELQKQVNVPEKSMTLETRDAVESLTKINEEEKISRENKKIETNQETPDKLDIKLKNKKSKIIAQEPEPSFSIFCCWAREKLHFPKMKRKHLCPRLCKCCCRIQLVKQTSWRMKTPTVQAITISDDEETLALSKKNNENEIEPSPVKVTDEIARIQSETFVPCDESKKNTNKPVPVKLTDEITSIQSEIFVPCDEGKENTNKPILVKLTDKITKIQSETFVPCDEGKENTNKPIPVKLTDEITTIQSETFVPCDEGKENTNKNTNVDSNDVIAITNSNIIETNQTLSATTNQSSNNQPNEAAIEVQIDPFKMPRINVLPSSALIAPTIRPIGRGNKYIKLIPEKLQPSSKKIAINKNLTPENQPIIVTNRDTGKSTKRILYLNSSADNGSPIFLGRNKILLTDSKFPDSVSTPANNLSATNVSNSLLPEGVQIYLMPDGKVSCAVDPTAKLDADKLDYLPQILSAVQQQLTTSNVPPLHVNLSQNTSEVISLIDEEIKDDSVAPGKKFESSNDLSIVDSSTQKTEDIISKTIEHTSENKILQDVSNSCDSKISEEQVVTMTSQDNIQSNQECETVMEVENTPAKVEEQTGILMDIVNTAKPVPYNSENQIGITKEIVANMEEGSTECAPIPDDLRDKNSSDIKNSEDENIKSNTSKNTVLLDLMEMSGISMEDVTPAPADNQPSNIPTPYINEPIDGPLFLQTGVNATPIITNSPQKNLSELSSVSSFAQLKYACENNKKFFTLDLETGNVSPINVCVKKTNQNSKNLFLNKKTIIDLTDDKDCEEDGVIPNPRSILKPFEKPSRTEAKPLKLFKSVGILNRNRNQKLYTKITDLLKDKVRQRKQPIAIHKSAEKLKRGALKPLTEEYLESESSDDEPLATKAKRMRCEDNPPPPSSESTPSKSNVTDETIDLNMTDERHDEKINENMPQENNDDELEAEIAFLCDDNGSDDNGDCILGV